MDEFMFYLLHSAWFIPILIVLALFDGVMKVIAMWKAARNNQLVWFIIIAVFNTMGVLPLIYIIMDKNGAFRYENKEFDAD